MMKSRLLIAFSLALVISIALTLWLSRMYIRSLSHRPGKLHYVATRQAIDSGDLLSADNLQLVDWYGAPLDGAFTHIEDVSGKTVLYPIAAGEPLLEHQLGAAGAGLSSHIPPGMRAISLKSNEVMGVAGYLLPGSHVDVLATLYPHAGQTEASTSTVLQDAQVLTAGQKMQPDPEGKATRVDVVTLLVSPEDAERVVLASTQGNVHFVLRNGSDRVKRVTRDVRISALAEPPQSVPISPAATVPAPKPVITASREKPAAHYSVQMLRGDKESVDTF